jgi:hypothetical protein
METTSEALSASINEQDELDHEWETDDSTNEITEDDEFEIEHCYDLLGEADSNAKYQLSPDPIVAKITQSIPEAQTRVDQTSSVATDACICRYLQIRKHKV